MTDKKHTYPWPEPQSVYDNSGPSAPTTFRMEGAWLQVTPTNKIGCDTGRTRYWVECLTCNEILHEATTGPKYYIEKHLSEKHCKVHCRVPRRVGP
jgi:hypothetical protein